MKKHIQCFFENNNSQNRRKGNHLKEQLQMKSTRTFHNICIVNYNRWFLHKCQPHSPKLVTDTNVLDHCTYYCAVRVIGPRIVGRE